MKKLSHEILNITYPIIYENNPSQMDESFSDVLSTAVRGVGRTAKSVLPGAIETAARIAGAAITGETKFSGGIVDVAKKSIQGVSKAGEFLNKTFSVKTQAYINLIKSWGLEDNFKQNKEYYENIEKMMSQVRTGNLNIDNGKSQTSDFRYFVLLTLASGFQGNLVPNLRLETNMRSSEAFEFEKNFVTSKFFSDICSRDKLISPITYKKNTAFVEAFTQDAALIHLDSSVNKYNKGMYFKEILYNYGGRENDFVVKWNNRGKGKGYKLLILKYDKDVLSSRVIYSNDMENYILVKGKEDDCVSDNLEYTIKKDGTDFISKLSGEKHDIAIVLSIFDDYSGEYTIISDPFLLKTYSSKKNEPVTFKTEFLSLISSAVKDGMKGVLGSPDAKAIGLKDEYGVKSYSLVLTAVAYKIFVPVFENDAQHSGNLLSIRFPFSNIADNSLSSIVVSGAELSQKKTLAQRYPTDSGFTKLNHVL